MVFFYPRELRSAGVTVAEPRGGFYMFPNFEVIRPALVRRGITTGQAMCDAMLTDISVAVSGFPIVMHNSTCL